MAESLIIFINLERIETQMNLTEYSLKNGNLENAFQHSYIPHSATFPAWNRTIDHGDGFVPMIDAKTGTYINFISRPLKGKVFRILRRRTKMESNQC
jgi:hypothetical protein